MRSQQSLPLIGFALLGLGSQLMPSALAIPNPIDHASKQSSQLELPTEPPTPPPTGRRTPGGGLDGPSVCPAKPQPLTALTPSDVHGTTLSEQPTFWFYMPYTSAEVKTGSFSVLTWNETERVYGGEFKLPDKPGIVSITLPASEVSLEEGVPYHWYVNLDCTPTQDSKADLKIDGWVERLAPTPEHEQRVNNSSPDIWYDAIHTLAEQLHTEPNQTPSLREAWDQLLTFVALGELSQEPVLGPVMFTDESVSVSQVP